MSLYINFRCVDPIDKAFAQGLAMLVISLFAFIPGPILFGALIGKKKLFKKKNENLQLIFQMRPV
jgi:Organic Anion Transporter Polypeptide (OATP) family